jgi:hypothetical protein
MRANRSGQQWTTVGTFVAGIVLMIVMIFPGRLPAQGGGPPECRLESAIYLNPENWRCLGGPCTGGYCCLICTE